MKIENDLAILPSHDNAHQTVNEVLARQNVKKTQLTTMTLYIMIV